jgi:hypothetical protein
MNRYKVIASVNVQPVEQIVFIAVAGRCDLAVG